jgi:hypothetical protein
VKQLFADRKPITWYSLSATGRKALKRHLDALQQLVGSTTLPGQ